MEILELQRGQGLDIARHLVDRNRRTQNRRDVTTSICGSARAASGAGAVPCADADCCSGRNKTRPARKHDAGTAVAPRQVRNPSPEPGPAHKDARNPDCPIKTQACRIGGRVRKGQQNALKRMVIVCG